MHVVDETPDVMAEAASPDWVADWWMPPESTAAVDDDLEALLDPEPAPVIAVEVNGRVSDREAAAV